jgi:hypothetical protein
MYYGRPLPRHSWAPESFILQQKGEPDKPIDVYYHFLEQPEPQTSEKDFECQYEVQLGDIIPQVKRVQYDTAQMKKKPKFIP